MERSEESPCFEAGEPEVGALDNMEDYVMPGSVIETPSPGPRASVKPDDLAIGLDGGPDDMSGNVGQKVDFLDASENVGLELPMVNEQAALVVCAAADVTTDAEEEMEL